MRSPAVNRVTVNSVANRYASASIQQSATSKRRAGSSINPTASRLRNNSISRATTAANRPGERNDSPRSDPVVARLLELFRERDAAGLVDDPSLRLEVADCWMEVEAYRLATEYTVTRLASGERIGPESSLNKVWWSEMDIHLHRTALELLGEDADLEGAWLKGYEFALAGPIYAGTNEVQRNVIAERLLGMPRR
jgi:hypothetical protein